MRSLYICIFIFISTFSYGKAECDKIQNRWSNEEIYFISNMNSYGSIEGTYLDYDTKFCYKVSHKLEKCSISKISCDSKLVHLSNDDGFKTRDFGTYLSEFKKCFSPLKKICIRKFISKSIKVNFGYSPIGDRRELFFEQYDDKDISNILPMILNKKFDLKSSDSKNFGNWNENIPGSLRGTFSKVNGYWKMVSYIGGD